MNRRTPLFYYGWAVLAASAVVELLMTGLTGFSAGLFVLPLQGEFHLSRADAQTPVLLLYLGAALCGPIAGRALDRFPIRPVMWLGGALFCLALVTIALSSSLALMALMLLVPAALGYLVLGMLNTATLASRWFFRHRGLSLGIAAVATSGGGLVAPFLARLIASQGWRTALLYEAAFFAMAVVLASLIIRDDPGRMGLEHHPENRGRNQASRPGAHGGSSLKGELQRWGTILSTRGFWAPSLVVATILGISGAIVTVIPAYGVQLGFSTIAATGLISLFSAAAILTKIAAGILSDLVDKRLVLLFASASMMGSLALFGLPSNFTVLLAAATLAGIAQGAALPTASALIAARFGGARFGATMGWTYLLIGALTIAGGRLSGTLFDMSGGYNSGFGVFLVFSAAISVIALMLEWKIPPTARES